MIVSTLSNTKIKHLLQDLFNEPESSPSKIHIPAYQRKSGKWSRSLKTNLIITILKQAMPISPIVIGKHVSGRLDLIDGLQRMSTLQSFRNSQFSLYCPEFPNYHGKRFKDMSTQEKDIISNYSIDCRTFVGITDDEEGYQAFLSVNAGLSLTSFEKKKGYKDCYELLNDLQEDEFIFKGLENIFSNLGATWEEKLISALAMSEGVFNSSTVPKGQWTFVDNIDSMCSNHKYMPDWKKIISFTNTLQLGRMNKDSSAGVYFLAALLMSDIHKLPQQKEYFQSLIDEDFFSELSEDLEFSDVNKKSGGPTRQKRHNRIYAEFFNPKQKKTYFTRTQVKDKLKEQGDKCNSCFSEIGMAFAEGDHIIPLDKGGKTELSNLQVLCGSCNRNKGTK